MFPWFRSKPAAPPADDRVWINEAARLAAIVRTAQSGRVLIVTFFEETQERVAAAVQQAGVESATVGFGHSGRLTDGRVVLCAVERVGSLFGPAPADMTVCIAEHHPLPEVNTALLEALATLTSAKPVFHVALDEPLMRRFAGDRVAALMAQLGIAPDEPVEHPMVSRALANAREKVAAKVRTPQPARSMEEWLRFNLGDET